MRWALGILALVGIFSFPARAQETPVFQFGGGYTFRSLDVPGGPRLNMNGWNATAEYNIARWLAGAADFDGSYKDEGVNGKTSVYTFLFGPRVYPLGHHKLSPFAHALFGIGHAKVTIPQPPGPSAVFSENDFAFAIGGGIDWTLNSRLAVRLGKFDYEQTRFFGAGTPGTPNQNNFKYSAALLIRLGQK